MCFTLVEKDKRLVFPHIFERHLDTVMNDKIIIIGGGGHSKPVIDAIICAGDIPVGILDRRFGELSDILGVPVLGTTDDWKKYTDCKFVIAIGNNGIRKALAESIDVDWHTVIHPAATVSRFARVGKGTVVFAGAAVNPGANVGAHCIINTCAVIEHDCTVCDYAHISPTAALSGTTYVGECTHLGTGVKTVNNISVCGNCVIGAGAVIAKDITEPGVYVGVPTRRIK